MNDYILTLIGTNHKFSGMDLREKLSFPNNKLDIYLKEIHALDGIKEVMILSTCNRVEIVIVSNKPIKDQILEFISDYSGIDGNTLNKILYIKYDIDVVHHIFRVASSLDSMVVGEPQILGQLREAYKWSVEFLTSGAVTNRIMRRAFHTAKLVKSRTDIGKGAISVAYAAFLKIKELVDVGDKNVMIIGVGEMSELSTEHLASAGANIRYIANRTPDNALKLAQHYKADIIGIDSIKEAIRDVDIVVTSTSSKEPIIKKDDIAANKDLIIVDMAVPRDTEISIAALNNVYLIYLDDLKNIIENSLIFRKKQAKDAERIVEEEVENYKAYVESLDYEYVISKLRQMAEHIRQREIRKFIKRHKNELNGDIINDVEALSNSIINKILHEPTQNIKLFIDHPEGDMYIELIKYLFKIEKPKKDIRCFFSENA